MSSAKTAKTGISFRSEAAITVRYSVSGAGLSAEAAAVRCREDSSEPAALRPEVGCLTLVEPG